MELGPFRVPARELDEVGADRVADAAAARVQHDPHAVRLVQAHLDEVVAAAERAELVRPARALALPLLDARMLLHYRRKFLLELLRRVLAHLAVLVLREAHRDVAADLTEDF